MYKLLIKKFSYQEIITEIHKNKKHWTLPSSTELRDYCEYNDCDTENVWVRDVPPNTEDWPTHAMMYHVPTGKTHLCNKSFMQNIIVRKIQPRKKRSVS